MDSTSPNQLAFNIWKHSNWLRPERNVKFLLNFRPHAAAFIRSNYKIMLIDQRDDDLREGENFWIGMLLTNQGGLNSHHDFVQQ